MEIIEKLVAVLEKIVKMIKDYGFFNIIKSIMLIVILVGMFIFVTNLPDMIKTAITESKQEQVETHDRAIEIRKKIKPAIEAELHKTLTDLNADRIFILELHNGTNNTAGLPFLYAEMTYCCVKENIHHIDEDYNNLNLSRFSFPMYLEEHKYWHGTVEELRKIDEKLALRLMSNNVKYLAILTLQGLKTELGYFGVTYTNDTIISNEQQYIMKLTLSSQKISTFLDVPIQ